MNRGPVPPTAYEMALTSAASNVHVASVADLAKHAAKSVGESDSTNAAKRTISGKPKLVYYRNTDDKGDIGRVSRKIEQIALFTAKPPEYNNANSYTRPDFRAGILAKYFDVQAVDIKPGVESPFGENPGIVLFNTKGDQIATLNAAECLTGKLFATMNAVLKEEGVDVHRTVLKASSVLSKLYAIEIDIQKLKKRNQTRSIRERIALNEKIKEKGLDMYKELLGDL